MRYRKIFGFALSLLPAISLASWQIAGAPVRTPGTQPIKRVVDTPKEYQANPRYTLHVTKGSLYKLVKQYTTSHGWQLVWTAKRNYPVNYANTIAGPSLQAVLNQLLSHYPLRVSYNKWDQVVYVRP